MKKRIVSFLLALVMAVSLLPVSAFAVEDTASPDVPAVVEPEAQTAAQQGNDVVIEDDGVQVYADDGMVTLDIQKDGVYINSTKLDTISDEVNITSEKNGQLKITTTYIYTADKAEKVTLSNKTGRLLGTSKSTYLDGTNFSIKKNGSITLTQMKATTETNLQSAGLKSYVKDCNKYYYFCFERTGLFGLLI